MSFTPPIRIQGALVYPSRQVAPGTVNVVQGTNGVWSVYAPPQTLLRQVVKAVDFIQLHKQRPEALQICFT